jgi:hypothetical protein
VANVRIAFSIGLLPNKLPKIIVLAATSLHHIFIYTPEHESEFSMKNVIDINFHETQKCPKGSIALMPRIGICTVLSANGFERLISYREEPSDPNSEIVRTVPVQLLRHLDPWKDLTGS